MTSATAVARMRVGVCRSGLGGYGCVRLVQVVKGGMELHAIP
jgi:hypothetical protein